MQLRVNLAERSYDIEIGSGVFDKALDVFQKLVEKNISLFCIADSSVVRMHAQKANLISKFADIIQVDGGEASKCFEKVAQICSLLAEKKANRKSCIIA